MRYVTKTTALATFAMLLAAPAYAASDINPDDLLNMSLEQLANVEVTSVSKRAEKASEAAAAIYVISQDDIRRSGATTIPETLRMVPGLNVAQSGSHAWAVSSRGFNDQFADKLLVLIDGRSVYTPLYSGVYWDVQDTPLQDIERIEVIRGPGATLWGANAVNGVINIITKQAKDTQGGLASVSAGNFERSANTLRYGAKLGENAHARGYVKYIERDEARTAQGGAGDEWNKAQAGFRADWDSDNNKNSFTLQGDAYRGGENYVLNLPPLFAPSDVRETVRGGNILGRWTHKASATEETTLQVYYDNARRSSTLYEPDVDTFDIDLQHVMTPAKGHDVVIGGGYRLVRSDVKGDPFISFNPTDRSDDLFSAFIQDKITLVPDSLYLTLGSKFEHNDYTGFEYQPSARMSWIVDNNQTVWASVSRAVRTPNIASGDGSRLLLSPVGFAPLTFLARVGSDDTESEEMTAYELGYRIQPAQNISVDIAAFYNDYDNLVLGQTGTPTGPFASPTFGVPYFIVPVTAVNAGTAHIWGGEVSAKWNPTNYLEFAAGYSLQKLTFDQADPFGFSFAGKSPEQQFNVRSTVSLPYNIEWNTSAYFVDKLAARDLFSGQPTDEYTRIDTRIAWQATPGIELSLVGQNLFDPSHKEFNGFLYQSSAEIPRSYYANVTVKF